MTKGKDKEEKQTKLVWHVTPAELPKTARRLKRIKEYDEIIGAVAASKETSFKIDVEGRGYKKLWSPLSSRIKAFNANPVRQFNMQLRTSDKATFIVKTEKKD